jgi:HEPN domain-containing protein
MQMNREKLQDIARERLKDARILLRHRNWSGAYYLAGYAIECGLKACIAKRVRRFDFPDKRTVTDSHTHDLEQLVRVAGLRQQLSQDMASSKPLELNWAVVKDWAESARYELDTSQAEANDLYRAISRRSNGVMSWLRLHW